MDEWHKIAGFQKMIANLITSSNIALIYSTLLLFGICNSIKVPTTLFVNAELFAEPFVVFVRYTERRQVKDFVKSHFEI